MRARFLTEFVRRPAALVAVPIVLVALYFGGAAFLLRYGLDALLFPQGAPSAAALGAPEALRLRGQSGSALILRRFGNGLAGCVVYFPDRDGGVERYARELFADMQQAGLIVYAAAYPGQDGAPGRVISAELQALATQAVAAVMRQCGDSRTVVGGRALGGMVAAYAAGATRPAGLVIESTSPSLGAGLRAWLRERWYLRPLTLLPLGALVPHDYTLAEAMPSDLHVVIFQGSADAQAPIADLLPDDTEPAHPPIIEVPDGTHADTLARARPAMIATMLDMIRGSQAADADPRSRSSPPPAGAGPLSPERPGVRGPG